ncbi:nucleolar GTP-binding protein 1-like isoform X3 [Leguminivora glycinivorella]|uniref:nucleolar GTP-binding protein 1-like isoform X3 n=1 Tax=Leguminivora glycinivorella TaxID=1035111 RepID=UPI00200CD0DA|nr:nucleolar GTP-binding protein 1-like isoform X3 [Leguminivora glycinivorella]
MENGEQHLKKEPNKGFLDDIKKEFIVEEVFNDRRIGDGIVKANNDEVLQNQPTIIEDAVENIKKEFNLKEVLSDKSKEDIVEVTDKEKCPSEEHTAVKEVIENMKKENDVNDITNDRSKEENIEVMEDEGKGSIKEINSVKEIIDNVINKSLTQKYEQKSDERHVAVKDLVDNIKKEVLGDIPKNIEAEAMCLNEEEAVKDIKVENSQMDVLNDNLKDLGNAKCVKDGAESDDLYEDVLRALMDPSLAKDEVEPESVLQAMMVSAVQDNYYSVLFLRCR